MRRDALPLDLAGGELGEDELVRLFRARGEERQRVFAAADRLRREVYGDEVTYVVTRNIQYTNVCYFRCGFCAFSKGKLAANLRGPPYLVPLDEIVRRAEEAWERGATEVCLQGGIHPAFTGEYYAAVVARDQGRRARDARARLLGARDLAGRGDARASRSRDYLARLRDAGLGSLPGTAAEILDDEVRAVICPDKVTTAQWLEVHEAAHRVGLALERHDHVRPRRAARARGRGTSCACATSSGGPAASPSSCRCPFVHMEAPMYLKGRARRGPTFGEMLLMHAVARLALHPVDHERAGLVGEARPGGRARRRCAPASTTSAAR